MANKYKKGQHVLCRFRGDRNGDIVVGEVESVRSNGLVLIRNLMGSGDRLSQKKTSVLDKRNIVTDKRHAMKVVAFWESSRDRAKTREFAVGVAEQVQRERDEPLIHRKNPARPRPQPKPEMADPVVSTADLAAVAAKLKEVLEALREVTK